MATKTVVPSYAPPRLGERASSSSQLLHFLGSKTIRRWLQRVLAAVLFLCAVIPAWRHLYPPIAAEDWTYEVYLDAIERVSAIVADGQGGFFVSQEIQDTKGRLLQADASGQYKQVVAGLSKPDGLVRYRDGVVFSQEQGEHPVSWMNDLGTRQLFSADSIEGMATDGHYLYAIEDLHGNGRLLRYDFDSNTLTTLRTGLDEAEAIAYCPDGRMFYTEKVFGHVRQLLPDGSDPVVLTDLREPGFLLCNNDGLWITEDATHMARVLLWAGQEKPMVVLSHLRSPQTIVETTPGHYLVAEQGRNRVLKLDRKDADR